MRGAVLIVFTVAVWSTGCADVLETRQKFDREDFKFDIEDAPLSRAPEGARIRSILGAQFTPLQGLGIGMALFELPPCSLNALHVHPRSTEMIHVTAGERLKVGFAEENGGRVIINTLREGQFTVFPQGLAHFQFNASCKKVSFVSAQNNEDPGVQTFPARLFEFPLAVQMGSFGATEKELHEMKHLFSARSRQAKCLRRCGIKE